LPRRGRKSSWSPRPAVAGESQLHASVGRFAGAAPISLERWTRSRGAVTANPNDPAMHKLLAAALVQQDRTSEAFAEFVAALLIDPQDAEAHAGIGQIHLNAGRNDDALDALRRALDLAPDNIDARYALATGLERLGRTEEAGQYFARVALAQRQILADRRRTMSLGVLKEEAALRTSEGQLDLAIALYEKALGVEAEPAVYSGSRICTRKSGARLTRRGRKPITKKAVQSARTDGSGPR
jgi:tetratricopeptide (TPR) repeat protein